jgi:flagellar basal-body rod modification protein FlgD
MDPTPISNLFNQPVTTQAVGQAPGGAMGRDEFLELLTIQLQYQDPMNPISNQEFAAQLAQFSALEQMEQVNETLQTELLLAESSNNAMAAGLIGHNVRVVGNVFSVGEDGDAALPKLFTQTGEPGQATVRITDPSGDIVRSFEIDLETTDLTEIAWDGKDASGDPLEAGLYRVDVVMAGQDETSYPPVVLIEDQVSTLRFQGGLTELLLGTAPYTLADVYEIRA